VVTPRPDLTDAEVEALLGAYALDAVEPDEAVAIEAVLARIAAGGSIASVAPSHAAAFESSAA
jgi:hypothetical protein